MLFFKKKIYSNLYIFFLILIFIIIEFSTNITYSKNLIISDIEIEESYDLNFNKNKVLDKGFSEAFKNLTLIEQHKIIYNSLDEMITKEIHAVQLKTMTWGQWKKENSIYFIKL